MFIENDGSKNEKSLLKIEIMRLFYNFLDYQAKLSKSSVMKVDDFCFLDQLKSIKSCGATILYINFQHLMFFSEELADLIEDQFARIENSLKQSVKEFFKNIFNLTFSSKNIQIDRFKIGFYNLPNWKSFDLIRHCCYGKLICTIGKIVRITVPEPRIFLSVFECSNTKCNHKIKVAQNLTEFSEPKICSKCKSSDSWGILIEESIFIEVQRIRIQSFSGKHFEKNPDILLDAILIDDATNFLELGSKCVFTGCIIPLPLKDYNSINKYLTSEIFSENFSFTLPTGSIFSSIFLVNHIFCLGDNLNFLNLHKKKDFFIEEKGKKLSLKLKSWSFFLNILEKFFFNGIKKYEDLNFAILLFLVGGVDKKVSTNQFFRGNVNLSIVHSPNLVFKNLFMKLKNLNSQIIYVNVVNSSIVGLTVSLARDVETNSLCIDSGLFANRNKDIYFIDNFYYLDDNHHKQIVDCMEKQELRINKAELKLVIKSKISILAMTEFSYNKNLKIVPFLKTDGLQKKSDKKFDLNFFFENEDNFENEFSIWKSSILSDKKSETKIKKNNIWGIQLYLSYVKNLSPVIPTESYSFILKVYLFLRRVYFTKKKTGFEISARQLETLIRLSEAFGKLSLAPKILEFHIKAAARILFKSFHIQIPITKEKLTNEDVVKNCELTVQNEISQRVIKIRFSHYYLMVKKINLILKIKKKKIPGISMIDIIRSFFFYFSKASSGKIGLIQTKKIIKTLKNLTYGKKKFLVIKMSTKKNSPLDCLFLDKF